MKHCTLYASCPTNWGWGPLPVDTFRASTIRPAEQSAVYTFLASLRCTFFQTKNPAESGVI